MNDDDIICPCLDLKISDLKKAISDGASTIDEVTESTGAGSICGVCIDDVKEAVERLLKS